MELILIQNHKLGKVGEVVKVKNGYGRNWLLPRSIAIRATESNKKFFEEKQAEIMAQNEAKRAEATALVSKLTGLMVNIYRQAGEDGRLYGSVSAKDIATAIAEKGIEVAKETVEISDPIKYISISKVNIHLQPEIEETVLINVSRTVGEAESAANAYYENLKKPKEKAPEDYFVAPVAEVSEEVVAEVAAVDAEVEAPKKAKKAKKEQE